MVTLAESVARTVNVAVPGDVAIPLNVPADDRLNPAGNRPLSTDQAIAPTAPVAAKVAAYAAPTVVDGKVVVVITIADAAGACRIMFVRPATLIVALRIAPVVFAGAEDAIRPLLTPFAGKTASQAADEPVVHGHVGPVTRSM